jgi:hypothetical protein|nr:MAG TPA: hypothetical protein [Caudoviricetes sp.]
MSKKIISIGENTYKLVFDDFDDGVDLDNLLKIDYSNLIGEIVTFPIIVNKFGLLLADAESQVSEVKLSVDVYESKAKERLRIKLQEENGGKNPTIDALNSAVIQDKGYQAMRRKLIEVQKVRDYVNSAFWAAKDKSEKLSKLSLTVQNGEIPDEMLQGKINNIVIKKVRRTIE